MYACSPLYSLITGQVQSQSNNSLSLLFLMALTAHSDPLAHTLIRKMGKENGCFPVISKRQRLMSSLQVAKCECSGFRLVETHSLQPHGAVKVPLKDTPADLQRKGAPLRPL